MTGVWHILGAGSMGCLWAARLADAGRDVHLLLRTPETLQQFQGQSGLLLREGESARQITLQAACVDDELPPIEHLLITTKAQQTLDALRAIESSLAEEACIVLLQNGMGVAEVLQARYPKARLLLGSSTDGAWRPQRFEVVHAGRGATHIGPFDAAFPDALLQAVLEDFQVDGLDVQLDPDMTTRLWTKLAINCAINPLTALLNCRNGQLHDTPEARALLSGVVTEIDSVLKARGIELPQPLASIVDAVVQGTAANVSSMCQDKRAGRETEIDHINGFLVKQAEALGIAVPLNRQLHQLLSAAWRLN